jgi:hypothetical protein
MFQLTCKSWKSFTSDRRTALATSIDRAAVDMWHGEIHLAGPNLGRPSATPLPRLTEGQAETIVSAADGFCEGSAHAAMPIVRTLVQEQFANMIALPGFPTRDG